MARDIEDAIGDRGAILGAGEAARAEPVAQEAVERLIRARKRFQDLDGHLQARRRPHRPDALTARKITAAPSNVMKVVAARGCW